MKEYFELDPKEKKQEWLLLILVILFCLTIVTGIYFQVQKKDHDNILVPLFFSLGGCCFLIYSINAFGKGNLVQKGTPAYIFKILFFLITKLTSSDAGHAKRSVIKLLGITSLIFSIASFITAIISTKMNF